MFLIKKCNRNVQFIIGSGNFEKTKPNSKDSTGVLLVVCGVRQMVKHKIRRKKPEPRGGQPLLVYWLCLVFISSIKLYVVVLSDAGCDGVLGDCFVMLVESVGVMQALPIGELDPSIVRLGPELEQVLVLVLVLVLLVFLLKLGKTSYLLKMSPGAIKLTTKIIVCVCMCLRFLWCVPYLSNSEFPPFFKGKDGRIITELYVGIGTAVKLTLDRRGSLEVPVVSQWFYKKLYVELVPISQSRGNLSGPLEVNLNMQELSIMINIQAAYYQSSKSMYQNYGEIGQTIKDLMDEYQRKVSTQQKVESITDMKHFVENYPQFKILSNLVAGHICQIGELRRLKSATYLFLIKCVEPNICGIRNNLDKRVHELVKSTKVREVDAALLVMLYALRYQGHERNDTRGLIGALKKRSVEQQYLKVLSSLLDYGGSKSRQSDLFGSQIPQDVSAIKSRLFKGLKGVDNVYTQHKPLLLDTLTELVKGRLREGFFPYCGQPNDPQRSRLKTVIVFVVGGVTYEESAAVHQFNCDNPSIQVVLGGTTVHNSQSFLAAVDTTMDGLPHRALRIDI
ncbi:unnamed protein product, partial [Meganyctiphanes norvegica]